MKKLFTIAKKEYMRVVRRKGFIISTILSPLIMAGFVFLPNQLMKIAEEKQKVIAVVDDSGFIFDRLEESLDRKLPTGERVYILERAKREDKERLIERIERNEIYAFLIIGKDILNTRFFEIYLKNVSDYKTIGEIEDKLSSAISSFSLLSKGINPDVVQEAIKKVNAVTIKVVKGKEKKTGIMGEFLFSIFMVSLLFGIILGYGQVIMNGVLEEKTNRIIEIMLSSVNSFKLMAGKIIGIGSAGLTQVIIWVLFAIFLFSSNLNIVSGVRPSIDKNLLLFFVLFFVLGYLMYASFFAAVGAIAGNIQEAQQMMTPITYMIVIPYIIGIGFSSSPNSTPMVILSIFPLFTPILMLMRMTYVFPPLWQVYLSISLLIGTTFLIILATSKIFRTGILLYGKRPSFSEILRWIKY
jgi:ABC-2 type transport system permease protein